MNSKYLILQTAFYGDVILTLPVVQLLKEKFPDAAVDFMCIPETAEILRNNPLINEVIVYDKKNSGLNGLWEIMKKIRSIKYDAVISPHRSFRSALICFLSASGVTVTFDKSSLSFLYDKRISYKKELHEIQRNISLLNPLEISESKIIRPEIFFSERETRRIDCLFYEHNIKTGEKFIVISPGSVWFTKRFPENKFINLCNLLCGSNIRIFLAGSKKDKSISDFIVNNSKNKNLINVTGKLSILESAELIRRAALLVSNDSAPLHIANSLCTDVYAIFGATVPSFGFYPYRENDLVFEINGLKCRPCSIHGGNKCPVSTFECMNNIDEKIIADKIKEALS